ncbi:MAG: hypothetical protein IID40_03705 [Planctomycetes bacterium]|nr:hypothetical protein [Planctomycetota bacterium]
MARASKPSVFVMEAQSKAALPAIESFARAGLHVVAGSEKRFNSGFSSRCCRERQLYPSPRYDPDGFKTWLLDFLARRDFELLFPIGHYGSIAVAEIQREIRRHTLLLMPEEAIFRAGYEKIPTLKTALAAGVPIPETWFPNDYIGGIKEVIPLIKNWPVLIKPSVGVGARGMRWCPSADELVWRFPKAEVECGPSFVQDFVPAGGMQYKVDMLVDAGQRRLAGIVYGKTRMYPPDGGSSVLNFSADRPEILRLAHDMLVQLAWVGFCDFDFVVDPRDQQAKLLEINPRPPESFRMGTSVGIDFPMMIYRLAKGETVPPVDDYPKDRFLRFLPADLLWFLRVDNRQRFGTYPNWFDFFNDHTAYQIVNRRDIGPLIGYVMESLSMIFDRKLRRERLRLKSGPTGSST